MHSLYNLLLYLALPFALLRLLWRSRRLPAYRERWGERLGYYDGADLKARFWIHAVSVGEVQAAQPVIPTCWSAIPARGWWSPPPPQPAQRASGPFSASASATSMSPLTSGSRWNVTWTPWPRVWS